MATLVVAQLLFLEAENPKKEVSMYINSPGGMVTSQSLPQAAPEITSTDHPPLTAMRRLTCAVALPVFIAWMPVVRRAFR